MLNRLARLVLISLLSTPPIWAAGTHARPMHLSTDGRNDPLGIAAAAPRLAWILSPSELRGVHQTDFQVRVATSAELLSHPDLWDSGRIRSGDLSSVYGGKPLPPSATIFWQVRSWQTSLCMPLPIPSAWSSPATFITSPATWAALWITDSNPNLWNKADDPRPLPLFRRSFVLRHRPTRALLLVSGLGQYEAHINGRNVTRDVMTPGWTDYNKHVFYNTYDVLALLHSKGPNAMGVMLGNSMYNVPVSPGRYTKFTATPRQPKLTLALLVTFADGTTQTISTDGSWKTHPGPITFSSAYGGEDFDARLDLPGWDSIGFDDRQWQNAIETSGPGGRLVPEQAPPIRPFETYTPVRTKYPEAGVVVYDLGKNFAGWPEIGATGPPGTRIKLIAGELLDDNGYVSQRSDNVFPDAPNLFTFTLRGTGRLESWHPRFSYWSFRYVQVEVSNRAAKIVTLQGQFLHAAAPVVGHFSASISTPPTPNLFNRIHNLIDRAILSNMFSVLTDCPSREKLGWLEQTHLAAATIMSNFDVSLLYRKMEDDMEDDQLSDDSPGGYGGLIPDLVPEFVQFNNPSGEPGPFRDTPEWGSAVILSPWAAFQFYGDATPLRLHYTSMQRYLDYLRRRRSENPDHILAYGLGDWYDIGPGEPGLSKLTSLGVTATATYYQDLTAMAHIAELLGLEDDATAYTREAAEVRIAFNAKFFHSETNQYDRGSQTDNAMPLALGLVPEGHQAAVLSNLVADIVAHAYHVSSGEIGFHYVVRALTDTQRSDVLFKMLSTTSNPSYGYQLAQGATTLTEAWDAYPKSSQNHFMLGHGEEWFYRGLAGIDVDQSRPASEKIRVRPYIPDTNAAVDRASASIATPAGTITSSWIRNRNTLLLDITISPNSAATLTMPASFRRLITESGHAINRAPGVHVSGTPGTFLLSSGRFHFQSSKTLKRHSIANSLRRVVQGTAHDERSERTKCS